MSQRLPSVTIGIPSFNEEIMLPQLLNSLEKQKPNGFKVDSIVVLSDASSDSTDVIAQNWGGNVELLRNEKRGGKYSLMYALFQKQTNDCVVILDADVVIQDSNFLQKLVSPVLFDQADLVAARVKNLEATTWVEKALELSMELKYRVFDNFKNGQNLYTCHGRARAFSRKFAHSLPKNGEAIAEDAFSYLWLRKTAGKYVYVPQATVWYQLPSTVEDHRRQSNRFSAGMTELNLSTQINDLLRKESIPVTLYFQSALVSVTQKPLAFFQYVILFLITKAHSSTSLQTSKTWQVAKSSKRL